MMSVPPAWLARRLASNDNTRGALLREAWRRFCAWICLPPDKEVHRSDSQFRDVIALQTLIVGQLVGLVVYIHSSPEFELRVAMVYLGLVAIPLAGLCAIVWLHQTTNGNRRYAYPQITRRYGLIALATALPIAPGAAIWYANSLMPGQGVAKLIELEPVTVTKDGIKITDAVFELRVAALPDAKARPWTVQAFVYGAARKSWKIDYLECHFDKARKNKVEAFAVDGDSDWITDDTWVGTLGISSSGTYWITMLLSQRQGVDADIHGDITKEELRIRIVPQ